MSTKSASFKNLYVLVTMGVMTAMAVILERVIRLDFGTARFSLACVCTMISGLWFGPVCGGMVGGLQDVIGCILSGYPPNPLILISSTLYGVLPPILFAVLKKRIPWRFAAMCISVAVTMAVCSFGFTTPGLILFYGYHPLAVLQMRLLQYVIMMPVYCIVLWALYESPLTKYVQLFVTGSAGKESR